MVNFRIGDIGVLFQTLEQPQLDAITKEVFKRYVNYTTEYAEEQLTAFNILCQSTWMAIGHCIHNVLVEEEEGFKI